MISARYDGVEIQNTYRYRDYVYRTDEIARFEGKKYAGQRNYIRRFEKNYPEAVFRPLTHDDLPAIERFAVRFNATARNGDDEARTERESAFRIMQQTVHSRFRIGCMEYRGEIIGIALGERCGDTLTEHVEKALSAEFEGIYPALFQAFVRTFGGDCTYVNREDDAGERGLRTSKMQYHPERIVTKYDINVKNLLHFIDGVPTLQTERLTLDSITLSDADDYGRLCTDDARNRYWGYDYREDFPDGVPSGETFCRDIARDFAEHYAINFAIRLNGRLIGEVIVYHFDNRGGAEIGVRIASAHAGHGFGREAVAAVSDWALYRLGVSKLVAQCFRQNLASERMLSSLMRRVGDDGTMISFERTV
jgi:RimJ/RimL family protein N-acetyltransferase